MRATVASDQRRLAATRHADQDLFGQVVQGERRDCGLIVGGRTALGLADGQGSFPCPGGSSLACGTLAISPSPVFTKEARPMDYQSLRSAVTETCVGVRSCVELEPLGGPATSCSRPLTRWTTAPRPSTRSKTGASTARTSSASCWTRSPHKPTDENWRCSRPAGRQDAPLPSSGLGRFPGHAGGVPRPDTPPWRHRTASLMPCSVRDSLLDGVLFRFSRVGQAVTEATHRNAAALLRWSPTTLLFGGWDSTGPKGGQGAKYERAITAEVTGIHVLTGKKTELRASTRRGSKAV